MAEENIQSQIRGLIEIREKRGIVGTAIEQWVIDALTVLLKSELARSGAAQSATMQAVESSNIASVGYIGGDLHVVFKNRAQWVYRSVPRDVYDAMMEADSIGSYFAKNIKDKYEGEKYVG